MRALRCLVQTGGIAARGVKELPNKMADQKCLGNHLHSSRFLKQEDAEIPTLGLHSIEEYRPLVGNETVDRILAKVSELRDLRIVNISSTQYGGGVAEILSPLTLLMNTMGVEMGWRVIEGRSEFFAFTKELHNGLQGAPVEITDNKRRAYEQIVFENSLRMHLEHDVVIVHDPQPVPLVQHYQRTGPWIWCCHVDLSAPDPNVWHFLKPVIERSTRRCFHCRSTART